MQMKHSSLTTCTNIRKSKNPSFKLCRKVWENAEEVFIIVFFVNDSALLTNVSKLKPQRQGRGHLGLNRSPALLTVASVLLSFTVSQSNTRVSSHFEVVHHDNCVQKQSTQTAIVQAGYSIMSAAGYRRQWHWCNYSHHHQEETTVQVLHIVDEI